MEQTVPSNRFAPIAIVAAAALFVASCSRTEPLPTSVYEGHDGIDYEQLPPALQSTLVDLMYVTDRTPESDEEGNLRYGFGRSQSLAYGSVIVKLDEDMTWDELIGWTQGDASKDDIPVPQVVSTTELGRFPDTPFPVEMDDTGHIVRKPEIEAEHGRVRDAAIEELRRRLALTDRNVVWVSVHGVQTSFEEGARAISLSWHQRGRWGVPIYYSWPAGGSGIISGYSYDRESGEFTIFHLKQLLRALGSVPEIKRVNLFAHSRGTDVLLSALRELMIEARAAGDSPRVKFNFGDLVLVAPDMDIEVATQRLLAEAIGRGVEHTTVYVSEDDWAIGLATSMFSSKRRIGEMNPQDLTKEQRELFEKVTNVDIIFYRGSAGGTFGHSYYDTPEVFSDIVMLGQGRRAGAEYGRPLEPVAPHLWIIRDGYAP
jgi:esterase/lipase superfamily enzyme